MSKLVVMSLPLVCNVSGDVLATRGAAAASSCQDANVRNGNGVNSWHVLFVAASLYTNCLMAEVPAAAAAAAVR